MSPLTQAMREGVITRTQLKELMHRSNGPAFLRLAIWFGLMGFTTFLVGLSIGSVFVLPAMLLHGILLVHHFSLQHECCHYTAFKTRWLNDLLGHYCALVIMLPNRFFRYEHCDHHTYTQITGKDPEQIELPESIGGYLKYISSVPYWKAKFSELSRHTMGRITPEEKRFLPKEEYKTIVIEAQLMTLFYLIVFLLSVVFQTWAVVWYWFIPVILGEPVMRAIRMTEHVGRPNVHDMRMNTRSNHVSAPFRFLCWNMNYHAEHHYASSVPFHALPALNKILSDYIYTERRGYVGAHIDIISQLIGRTPRFGINPVLGNESPGAATAKLKEPSKRSID